MAKPDLHGGIGKWGNREVGKWGNGEMGKWGNGKEQTQSVTSHQSLVTSH